MRYLILFCLSLFFLERWYLVARHQCANAIEGLGMLLMGAISVIALGGFVFGWILP